jgi:hypothetical protein
MPRTKTSGKSVTHDQQISLFDLKEYLKTAPCVPVLRREVRAWKASGYKGATETSKTLLNYWFDTDHRLPNRKLFKYHDFQREAMETLIYVYEVLEIRTRKVCTSVVSRQILQLMCLCLHMMSLPVML